MLRKGTKIKFEQMSDFTGKPMIFRGEIIGHAAEIKKMWPEECGEVVDPAYLVKCKNSFGYTLHHLVFDEEITEDMKEIK